MQRLVTKEDLIMYPQLQQMGVSANQHFDFQFLAPEQKGYSNSDYDISEYTPVNYGIFKPKPKEPLKKWTKSLSKIYVINLAKRKDRMLQAVQQLNKYSIPFERIEAIEHEKGAEGLRLTMDELFKECIKKKYEAICVFEDDLDVIDLNINELMGRIMNNLPENYDIIYLGCQLCAIPEKTKVKEILKVNHAFATHAAIYSLKGMKLFISGKSEAPIDNYIVRHMQSRGNTYCTNPMLVSQIISHSDIYTDQEVMDWTPHLQHKFKDMVNKMQK